MAINEEGPFLVHLNVYDNSTLDCKLLHWLGFNFYLTSIRVHGHEYYMFNNETGIGFEDLNALIYYQDKKFLGLFPMGRTQMDPNQVLELVTNSLANDFTNDNYNNFTNNCNHYSDRLGQELTGKRIASWVDQSVKFGRFLQYGVDADGRRTEINTNGDRNDEIINQEGDEEARGARVYLYVYHVNAGDTQLMRSLGIGLYRSFVQGFTTTLHKGFTTRKVGLLDKAKGSSSTSGKSHKRARRKKGGGAGGFGGGGRGGGGPPAPPNDPVMGMCMKWRERMATWTCICESLNVCITCKEDKKIKCRFCGARPLFRRFLMTFKKGSRGKSRN